MMNFTMMTMATQISRAKRIVRMLERVLKKDHLYNEEELKLIREQLKLRLRQLELAVDALKAEIYSDVDAYKNSPAFKSITDYDELHDDDDGYPD